MKCMLKESTSHWRVQLMSFITLQCRLWCTLWSLYVSGFLNTWEHGRSQYRSGCGHLVASSQCKIQVELSPERCTEESDYWSHAPQTCALCITNRIWQISLLYDDCTYVWWGKGTSINGCRGSKSRQNLPAKKRFLSKGRKILTYALKYIKLTTFEYF